MEQAIAAPAAGPVLGLGGTYNFRSTAGYPAGTGFMREGGLFRSDALHRLNEDGRRLFADQRISRVIDLRDSEELRHSPSVLTDADTETVHHPIFGDGAGLPALTGSFTIASVYRYMVEERTDRIVGAVRLIADAPEGGVLVHCTAGKDRTGVVIASALSAVGVPRDQVVADYAASTVNLAGEWADHMLAVSADRFGEMNDDVRELIVGSPAEAIDRTLDLIDDLHGGVERMLRQHGFDDDALDRLQRRLVA